MAVLIWSSSPEVFLGSLHSQWPFPTEPKAPINNIYVLILTTYCKLGGERGRGGGGGRGNVGHDKNLGKSLH